MRNCTDMKETSSSWSHYVIFIAPKDLKNSVKLIINLACIIQGMCAITYSAPTFSVSLARGADINLALGNQCGTDYVYIPQGRGDNPAVTSDR